MIRKKYPVIFSLMTLLLGVFLPVFLLFNRSVAAEELDASKYTIGATDITLNGQPITEGTKLTFEDTLRVSTPITVKDDVQVNEGDTITFDLPAEVQPITKLTFSINDNYGEAVANIETDPTTKKVTVTFTDRFNQLKENRTVNVDFDVNLAREVRKEDGQTSITINGRPITVNVDEVIGFDDSEMINKWGKVNPDNPREIIWEARVNSNKHSIKGLVIEDKFNTEQMTLVGVTELKDINSWPFVTGSVEKDYSPEEIKNLTTETSEGFVLNLGDTENIVYLKYVTKLKEGQTVDSVSNVITMKFNSDESAKSQYTVQTVKGGGSATGDASDSQVVKAKKTIEGRQLKEGEFEFELKDDKGTVLQTAKNAADGSVTFDKVKFATVGEFNYTVVEKNTNVEKVTYDTTEYPVKVTVTDNKGVKTAKLEYVNGAAEFKNIYTPDPVTVSLSAKKVLEGRSLKANEFSFTATSADADAPSFEAAKNKADGSVDFGSAQFTKAGTYTYTIKEVAGSDEALEYDTTEHTAIVTVEADKTSGALSAKVAYDGASQAPVFTNKYQAKPVEVAFSVSKELTGRKLEAGEFSFEARLSGSQEAIQATNDANGNVTFEAVTFSSTGTFEYEIKEVAGSLAGVSYDKSTVKAIVKVSDDETGQLQAQVTYQKDGKETDKPGFTNSYKAAPTSQVLTAKKTLEGRKLEAGEFSFELLDADKKVLDTVKNDQNGQVTFKELQYDKVGTYKYTVKEVAGDLAGVTYDKAEHEITVVVTDNGQGALVAEVQGQAEVVFTNTYAAKPVQVSLDAKKSLIGRNLKEGEFTFSLTSEDATAPVFANASNDKDGKISFAPVSFDKTGSYQYTLQEVAGQAGGLTYDTSLYLVTIDVVDNGNGQLQASTSLSKDGQVVEEAVFNNLYQAKAATLTITAKKLLEGRELKDGEFSFELLQGDEVLATAKNDAAGLIEFKDIQFDQAGDFTYTIREVKGSDQTVVYDQNNFEVKVTVTDDGQGQLVAKQEGDVNFTNKLAPKKDQPKKDTPDNSSSSDDKETPEKKSGRVLPSTGQEMSWNFILLGLVAAGFALGLKSKEN